MDDTSLGVGGKAKASIVAVIWHEKVEGKPMEYVNGCMLIIFRRSFVEMITVSFYGNKLDDP